MAIGEALLTAEEYGVSPDVGPPTELIRGRIVELPPPKPRHGQICSKVSFLLNAFVSDRDLGHVLVNDSGFITRRNPDTVRGMDIAYFSYRRLPKGPLPDAYAGVAPELLFEVRSPSDSRRDIHEKVAEYLAAGVLVVCVLDPEPMTGHLSYPDQPPRTLGPDDELSLPECLGDFRVAVRRFFE